MIKLKNNDDKVKEIINYYLLTTKLKNVIRSGWISWGVERERVESIAEHIYGTCMLAIAIWSETLPEVNLSHVITMLTLHETEEILIGDITPFEDDEKQQIKAKGHEFVQKIFANLVTKELYFNIVKEFDEGKTPEAIFAKKCDKLECSLQARLYSDEGSLKIENAGEIKNDKRILNYKQKLGTDVAKYFCEFNNQYFDKDDIFFKINEHIKNNKLIKEEK